MRKGFLAGAAALHLLGCSISYAGTMGKEFTPSVVPYAVFEASYTWNTLQGFSINSISASPSTDGWGGRFGAGVIRSLNEKVGVLGEIGGGYYGRTKINVAGRQVNGQVNIDGYDALVGGIYSLGAIDLFGKVGFMVENARFNMFVANVGQATRTTRGVTIVGQNRARFNNTEALPEIKVGGIYNWNSNLGFTVAYLHVWGSDVFNRFTNTISFDGTGIQIVRNGSTNLENPSLNSIMFGINYNFA